MKTKAITLMIGIGMFFFGSIFPLHAQNNDLSSNLEVYKITTNQDGEEVAERVTETAPGDTLEYRLTYTNNTGDAISNLKPMLPVPAGLQYLAGTAQPKLEAASLDSTGNTFEALPIQREKTLESGETVMESVPAREFERLRWNISSLASQESVTAVARVWVIKNDSREGL